MPFLDFYTGGKYDFYIRLQILKFLLYTLISCNVSTDFYIESNSEQKLGFPPGMAEKLVMKSMHEWRCTTPTAQKTATSDEAIDSNSNVSQSSQLNLVQSEDYTHVPPVVQEIEIDSCSKLDNINRHSVQSFMTDHTSDSYNGAVRENYIWTQTLNDLDVLVKVPEHVKTSKNIRVNISSDEIKIDAKTSSSSEDSTWDNIFSGKLSFKIRKDESMWSLVSGKHINVRSL